MTSAGTKRKARAPRSLPIAAYESLEQLAQMWKGKAREQDLLPLLKQGYVVVRKVIPLADIAKWKKETEKVVSILDACTAAHAKEENKAKKEAKNKDRDPDETESDEEWGLCPHCPRILNFFFKSEWRTSQRQRRVSCPAWACMAFSKTPSLVTCALSTRPVVIQP